MDASIRRGKMLVTLIIGIFLSISLITIITYSIVIGSGKLDVQAIRFMMSLLLGYFLHQGHQWSRIVLMILSGLAALGSFISIFVITQHLVLGLVSIDLFILYTSCFILLAISKDIKEYMIYKRLM